jgi:hypothetical protein
VKHLVTGALAKYGISTGPCAKQDAVRKLIGRMRPVKTDKGLIRIGGDTDGGYLVPDDLKGLKACFSPGVSGTATFEAGMTLRGIPCYLADASVERPPTEDPLFHFTKKYLGVVDDDSTITLDTWVNHYAPGDSDLLLQMDIEGDEWPVLLNVSHATLMRFRIIVIEMHSMWRMMDRLGFRIINATFDKLLREFHVVHLHPNNCTDPVKVAGISVPSLMEITLLRRDSAKVLGPATDFPHPLDRKNVPERPDLVLPAEWYR